MNFFHSTEVAVFQSAFKEINSEFLLNVDRFLRLVWPGGNDNNYFFITTDFRSFVYGNICSMFSLTHNAHEPQEIPLLRRRFIAQVDYGLDFVAILTYEGSAFIAKDDWEWKSHGPLHLVSGPNAYSHISCCARHLVLVQRGGGRLAQLGNPQNGISIYDRIAMINLKNVTKIATGSHHVIALTGNGELHAMGRNASGQMGLSNSGLNVDLDTVRVPITEFKKTGQQILDVVCGESHTLVLLSDGSLYGCGSNRYGELGLGSEVQSTVLVRIPVTEPLVAVAARFPLSISMAFSREGNCWVWGRMRVAYNARMTPTNIGRIEPVTSFPDAMAKDHRYPMTFCLTWIRDTTLDNREYLTKYFSEKVLNNKTNSNVTFMVENRPIYLRREYLRLVSEFFDRMFANQWRQIDTINLDQQYTYDAFMTFMRMLHFGSITLTDENLEQLLDLAIHHQDDRMLQHCRRFMVRRLNASNQQWIARLAQKFNMEDIKELIRLRF